MKKLKNLKLDALKEVLTREQMKKITGGYWCPGIICDFQQHPCCPTFRCYADIFGAQTTCHP
jgi:natural product precursor